MLEILRLYFDNNNYYNFDHNNYNDHNDDNHSCM